MKKHAYLIIAHTNFLQLRKLLEALDDERNDIFVLIDKKSVFNKSTFDNVCKKSSLQFVKRISINWGGFSQIIAELTLFRAAFEHSSYVYYHLLSGMDLPLHNQDYIHAFFEKHGGYEFFTFTGNDIYRREKPELRMKYYYIFHDLSLGGIFGKLLNKIQDRLWIPVQRRIGVNRLKRKTFQIGYGANWVSVTNNFVQYGVV